MNASSSIVFKQYLKSNQLFVLRDEYKCQFLQNLIHEGTFSNGRALVISGDKGNNNPEQFAGVLLDILL